MKRLLILLVLVASVASCSSMKKVIVKDIALEDQKEILKEYQERSAWTRIVLEDMGDGGSVPRDEKVKIVDIDMHYTGAVVVRTLKKRNRISHPLDIDRPLSPEKIHAAIGDIFWFKDPILRQVEYIRKWGSKTGQAVIDHEVHIGMSAEAARESWGIPAKINVSEIGGKKNEQWVYPSGNRNKYIYTIDGKVSKWDD